MSDTEQKVTYAPKQSWQKFDCIMCSNQSHEVANCGTASIRFCKNPEHKKRATEMALDLAVCGTERYTVVEPAKGRVGGSAVDHPLTDTTETRDEQAEKLRQWLIESAYYSTGNAREFRAECGVSEFGVTGSVIAVDRTEYAIHVLRKDELEKLRERAEFSDEKTIEQYRALIDRQDRVIEQQAALIDKIRGLANDICTAKRCSNGEHALKRKMHDALARYDAAKGGK